MRHTKLTALFLTMLLALSLTLPASADVLWEPDNRFYENHQGDCEYHNRTYLANSPDGYVTLRSAPDGVAAAQVENGQRVNVYFLYQDWGYVNTASAEGWAPLSDLSLIYDYLSFEEEHGDEILPVDKAVTDPLFDAYLQTGKTTLVIWSYPNAEHFSHYYTGDQGLELLNALKEYGVFTYTDEEGHLWGFCSYLYGHRNFWILLDDPSAGDGVPPAPEDIPNSEIGERIVSVREIPAIPLVPARKPPLPPAATLLTGGLVAIAVLLSGGALWFFYGRKRKWEDCS